MNTRSLAFRLGVWYAALLTGVFALVGAGMFFGLRHFLQANMRDVLARRSAQIEQILASPAGEIQPAALKAAIELRIAPELNNRFVRVTRAPATVLYRSGPPADRSFDPDAVAPPAARWPGRGAVLRTITVGSERLLLLMTPLHVGAGDYLVEMGVSEGPMESLAERLLGSILVLLPALALLAAGGGYLLVNRALQPVDRIASTAQHLSLQNLAASLPQISTGDALERLTTSVNLMLGRLRDSLLSSRRFLADASHELRTPLTIIRGELQEMARGDGADAAEQRERMRSVLEEVFRLEHLVSSLLTLSRLDAGAAQSLWIEVDLTDLVTTTAEQMRLMAEDRGVTVRCLPMPQVWTRGDAGQIKQVIVNLLDNAIRFTPPGGTVTLRTGTLAKCSFLEVADTGIGIPSDAVAHIFDRFYRVDPARSREDGGGGLGLSIVKSICAAHGAQIDVNSTAGIGSRFRISFPQSDGLTWLERTAAAQPGATTACGAAPGQSRAAGAA